MVGPAEGARPRGTSRGRTLPLGGAFSRIRRVGALVGACLVLALAALWSAPAAAQSVALVSNLGRATRKSEA